MSYFEIGVYHVKHKINIGTLWRSAYQLGASGIFTIGKRYKTQHSDTYNVPNLIPLRHFLTIDEFLSQRPIGTQIIGIEMGGIKLSKFTHPNKAIYLLGAEDHGLPQKIIDKCNSVVSLEGIHENSFNVAVAGSIVMYNRMLRS